MEGSNNLENLLSSQAKDDGQFMNQNERVLGLFAKWPSPGLVKSRLAADTNPEWAADVAMAFLQDIIDRCCQLVVRRILVFSPDNSEKAFRKMLDGKFELMPQLGGDLGTRLSTFVAHWFEKKVSSVVLIGMDSPTLPLAFLEQAFDALEESEVVLGPATDGGYYLIGFNKFIPKLFEGIAWSTENVLLETVNKVRDLNLKLTMLPPWYDVDTLVDWKMLKGHLAGMRHSGKTLESPRTDKLVQDGQF